MNKYILRETPYLMKLSLVNQVNKCLKRKYPFDNLSISKQDNISVKRLKLDNMKVDNNKKRKYPFDKLSVSKQDNISVKRLKLEKNMLNK